MKFFLKMILMQDICEKLIFLSLQCELQRTLVALFPRYENFARDLFHVKFDKEQFCPLDISPEMILMQDMCEKLCFWAFEAPWGTKLHRDRCGHLVR